MPLVTGGLVYHGDAGLTGPTPAERALLIEIGFLNEEIDLCEGILSDNVDSIQMYDIYDPDPSMLPTTANPMQRKIASVTEYTPKPGTESGGVSRPRSRCVAHGDGLRGERPVPAAADGLSQHHDHRNLPAGSQAMEISPGDVHFIDKPERVPGGTKLTLPTSGRRPSSFAPRTWSCASAFARRLNKTGMSRLDWPSNKPSFSFSWPRKFTPGSWPMGTISAAPRI